MMKRHAFTLIELLVVIAIIAILAAILFPVFARARAKAMQAACISNLKQIALAEKMYASDYGDLWANKNCDTRPTFLQPYMKSMQLFVCPGAPPEHQPGIGSILPRRISYGFNDYMEGWGNGYTWWLTPESNMVSPAEIIMWGDSYGYYDYSCSLRFLQSPATCPSTPAMDAGLTSDPPFWPFANVDMRNSLIARHNGMVDVNFCDGHAKAMKLEQIISNTIFIGPEWPNSIVYRNFICGRKQGM